MAVADHFDTISMVEKTLEPLVLQVTTLVNTEGPTKKKKGRSIRAHVLVAAVEKAIEHFIQKGEQIADEDPDIKREMMDAVGEVRKTGDAMNFAAREFADDPCSSLKRGNMVRAARSLLTAVTKLMILADMIDVYVPLKALRVAEDDLRKLKNSDENEYVFESIPEIRRAVLMNRTNGDRDPTDIDPDVHQTMISKSNAHTDDDGVDEYPDISGITTAREAMRKMTEEDKQKIAQQVENFRNVKLKFDREVAKWEDDGNDIVFLAKDMCMILTEMTDFTRGRGPLKTTMDVINAAKKISEAGTKLDNLTRKIAKQCPESSTKEDLEVYLKNIELYCHQLNITSKVKADVQNISGELIVSGLDSATSLIKAAKNLIDAVISTVKASYIANNLIPK